MQLHLAASPRFVSALGSASALTAHDAALLAWLALEGPTPRARLAALLWPQSNQGAARNSLRQRLFKLRQQADFELITGTTTLALAAGVAHDLDDADTVLGDASESIGPEFDAWLALQRTRRRDRIRLSLTELCEMAEQAGDWADALAHAGELLAMEALSEAAHCRVMRLHYLAGDRAAALLAFDRCEQMLKHEVGAAPSAATLALLETIERSGPPAPSPSAAPLLRAVRAVPASVSRPPRCIGRQAAWAALCGARDAARVVLLSGEGGMGKSRLLSDLAHDDARSPPGVVIVTARPGDAAVPYALLGRFLHLLLREFSLAPDPAARKILARLLPDLGAAAPAAGADDPARLVHALDAVLSDAAAGGLRALLVDDLQFADDASVELLGLLIASGHTGWVVAMRPGELSAAGRALLDELGRATPMQAVTLQPLDSGEIAELLESLDIDGIGGIDASIQAEALQQRTGGNPLYLLETLKAALTAPAASSRALVPQGSRRGTLAPLVWPSAPNVVRLIQRRLSQLSAPALRVARCAAVAGHDLSSPLVAQVLGLHPLDLADAWAELEDAQVLGDGGFAHDLIAEAALASVPRAIVRPLHSEIAGFLELGQGEPARIANHWLAAGRPLQAVPHLQAAAAKARSTWRLREAAELHQHTAIILREAGQRRAAFDAFFDEANALSDIAVDERLVACGRSLRELADDEGQRAMLALVEFVLRVETRHLDEARQVAQAAVPLAQRAGLPEIESELLWGLAVMHWERREVADAVRLTERALDLLRTVDPATARLGRARNELRLTHALGVLFAAAGRYEQSSVRLIEAHGQARRLNDLRRELDAADALAANALEQGDLAQALRWSGEAMAGLEPIDVIPSSRAIKSATRATALAASGDLGAALALYDRVAQLCDGGSVRNKVLLMVRYELLHFELGRPDLAAKGLRSLRCIADPSPLECALVEAAMLSIGEKADADAVLEHVGSIDDVAVRARVLCLAQPGCEPARVLPLLGISLATARDCGAHGLWLGLQTRRVAALRAAGRGDEAAEAALAAWQRIEEGVTGSDLFPRIAAELCVALAASHPDLAQVIALRASAWMQRAASTLTALWRENYLMRGPALPLLRALPRALLPALGA